MPFARTKAATVEAIQLSVPIALARGDHGTIEGVPTDWLVCDDNGALSIRTDEEFNAQYDIVTPPAGFGA